MNQGLLVWGQQGVAQASSLGPSSPESLPHSEPWAHSFSAA